MKNTVYATFRKVALCAAPFLVLQSTTFAAAILSYNFNEAGGTTALNSGTGVGYNLTLENSSGVPTDYHSATSPGGIPGPAGGTNQSLNLTSATGMGSAGTGPAAFSSTAGSVFNGATSFTMTLWYDATATPNSAARWLNLGGSGNTFLASFNNNISFQIGSTTISSNSGGTGNAINGVVNAWTFIALTYYNDGTNTTVNFYRGDTDSASSLLDYTVTFATSAGNTVGTGYTNAYLGNASGFARPFDGSFDDFNVYVATSGAGGALSASDLNALRQAQLVPEPSSVALFALGIAGVAFKLRTSRRRNGF